MPAGEEIGREIFLADRFALRLSQEQLIQQDSRSSSRSFSIEGVLTYRTQSLIIQLPGRIISIESVGKSAAKADFSPFYGLIWEGLRFLGAIMPSGTPSINSST